MGERAASDGRPEAGARDGRDKPLPASGWVVVGGLAAGTGLLVRGLLRMAFEAAFDGPLEPAALVVPVSFLTVLAVRSETSPWWRNLVRGLIAYPFGPLLGLAVAGLATLLSPLAFLLLGLALGVGSSSSLLLLVHRRRRRRERRLR